MAHITILFWRGNMCDITVRRGENGVRTGLMKKGFAAKFGPWTVYLGIEART